MLFGNGLLAQSFAPSFRGSEDLVVFASGVSDSQCSIESEYSREAELLQDALRVHADAKLFLYFSTCSIFDPDARESRYVRHKLQMEKLVAQLGAHLVFRLPIVVGPTGNARSLVRFLAERIIAGQPVDVWKNAGRYLIDVEDVVAIGLDLINREGIRNECVNIAGPRCTPVPELVETIGRVVGKRPECRYIERGSTYSLDTRRISASVTSLDIRFDRDYVERTLQKYYGSTH